jgi:hypothetical protein
MNLLSVTFTVIQAVMAYYTIRSLRRRIADALRWLSIASAKLAEKVDDR